MEALAPALPWTLKKSPRANQCPVRGCRNHSRTTGRETTARAKLCSRHAMRLWRMEQPERAHFAQIKDRAARNEIAFTITLEEYLKIIEGTRYTDERGRARFCLHLDRIDPLRGYERGNLRVITAGENCTKGATADKERRQAHVAAKIAARQNQNVAPDSDPEPQPEPEETYRHEPTETEPF